MSRPYPRCMASPFPEPAGIMPKITSLPTRAEATSLIEPSPPTATTNSYPSWMALVANSAAWPSCSVCQMPYSNFLWFKCLSILSRMCFCKFVPAFGFTMNTMRLGRSRYANNSFFMTGCDSRMIPFTCSFLSLVLFPIHHISSPAIDHCLHILRQLWFKAHVFLGGRMLKSQNFGMQGLTRQKCQVCFYKLAVFWVQGSFEDLVATISDIAKKGVANGF